MINDLVHDQPGPWNRQKRDYRAASHFGTRAMCTTRAPTKTMETRSGAHSPPTGMWMESGAYANVRNIFKWSINCKGVENERWNERNKNRNIKRGNKASKLIKKGG